MWRILIAMAALFLVLGGIAWLMEQAGLRPGRLPGDIVSERGNVRVYFPIVTSIVLSVVLTLVFWLVGQFRR